MWQCGLDIMKRRIIISIRHENLLLPLKIINLKDMIPEIEKIKNQDKTISFINGATHQIYENFKFVTNLVIYLYEI